MTVVCLSDFLPFSQVKLTGCLAKVYFLFHYLTLPYLLAALLDDQQRATREPPSRERHQPTVKDIVEAAMIHHLSLDTDNANNNTDTDTKSIPPELGR